MRILFIITQSEIGGAQRYLIQFSKYLSEKGNDISVIAGEGDEELFKYLNCRTFSVKSLVRNPNPAKDFLALLSIIKITKRENPDVLFLQSTKAGFIGALAARFYTLLTARPKPYVVYRIGGWSFNDPRSARMNKVLFWMEQTSAQMKDKIIVNSELDRQIAIDKKISPPDKIVKIYNGIDPDGIQFLSKEEARKNFPQGNKIVGTIANLYATKGIEYLIEAARTLPDVNFVVIGEGKEREKLELLIKKYNLNNFLLAGRIINAREYLKAFDIFILPSVKEGFPWAILEAMSAELPIISTNVGAIPEIIEDKKEGELIPHKNSRAIAQAIKFLIENPGVSGELAKNAKEKLKKFTLEKMLEESEKILSAK